MDVSRCCCNEGGTIELPSGVVAELDWLQYEKGLSASVTFTGSTGDPGFQKSNDALGILVSAYGFAVRIAATDLPAAISSAVGRFTAYSFASPEADQTVSIYAIRDSGGSSYAVASMEGPTAWSIPDTPEVGAYPPGTVLETPDVSSIINAVTSVGGWSGTDKLWLMFRQTNASDWTENSRSVKRLATTFELEWS